MALASATRAIAVIVRDHVAAWDDEQGSRRRRRTLRIGPRMRKLLQTVSASRRASKRSAYRVHPRRIELCDRLGEQRSWHRPQVVEADRAHDRHTVRWSKLDLGLDPADRAGDERDDDVSQSRQRLLAGEHNDRPAPLLFEFKPANLAAGYQGSSRIASRAFARAQASSTTPRSSVSAHRSSASRSRTSRVRAASASASLSSSTSWWSFSRVVTRSNVSPWLRSKRGLAAARPLGAPSQRGWSRCLKRLSLSQRQATAREAANRTADTAGFSRQTRSQARLVRASEIEPAQERSAEEWSLSLANRGAGVF